MNVLPYSLATGKEPVTTELLEWVSLWNLNLTEVTTEHHCEIIKLGVRATDESEVPSMPNRESRINLALALLSFLRKHTVYCSQRVLCASKSL